MKWAQVPLRTLVLLSVCLITSVDNVSGGITIVNTLNLQDYGSAWISASVYGNIYSFLSQKVLWWGNLENNKIDISGIAIPPAFQPNLAVVVGFGFDPKTKHFVVMLYAYSNTTNAVSLLVYDMKTGTWSTPRIVGVTMRDYQYLIADSEDLQAMTSLFLISLNHIVYIDLYSFTIVAEMDLRQQFVSEYPVSLIAGVTFYGSNLFIARSESLNGTTLAQIVEINVRNDFNFKALFFNHVVYLDSNCDNMFGWGNYLFWSQLRGQNGTVYGWNLRGAKQLLYASVNLGPGNIWGKGLGTNSTIGQAMLVSGNPRGGGYTAWVAYHDDRHVSFVDSLFIPNDVLPALGTQTIAGTSEGLSVLLAGHNATGFGKLTWLKYS
jgi:hypothetical protein